MRGVRTDKEGPRGKDLQPLANIEWVRPDTLKANAWNPNKVFRPELKLIKISLLETGWACPIVVGQDDEIVDGFHRWTLACNDPEVLQIADGLVPIVRTANSDDPATRRMETVRMNRARGAHHVVKMADLVFELHEMGVADAEIANRLGMDSEEVARLLTRGKMTERAAGEEFGEAWAPDREADKEVVERLEAMREAEEAERRKTRTVDHEQKTT